MNQDTIAAIATPPGSGGIGIIRISGEKALTVARRLFRRNAANGHENATDHWISHRLYYGHIVDPENGQIIDEVLMALMRAPHSYTRQDIVEIQCHGGAAVLKRILAQVLKLGIRPADAGEFTRRAFLNGRIDLSQAEAVADVINARSLRALDIAARQLGGEMKQTIAGWIERLNHWLAELQAEIEFGDELGTVVNRETIQAGLESNVLTPIRKMIDDFDKGHLMRDGVRLCIAGRPNVGKSSLLNRLLKQERAIVTPIAGTTRDTIEQDFTIQGIPVTIMDTAGIRISQDPIERLGVEKACETAAKADLVLFMVEASDPMNPDDHTALSSADGWAKTILVANKTDLIDKRMFKLPDPRPLQPAAIVGLSALTGDGMGDLETAIVQQCMKTENLDGPMIIPTVRQKAALEQARESLERGCEGLRQGASDELVACDLAVTVGALQTISGEGVEVDLLDQIFSRFCIGK